MKGLNIQLKSLRIKAGLQQNELAERAKVSPAFISKLESGEYTTLSVETCHQLAKGLGMTFRDFLEEVGFLENSPNPNAEMALANALRKRSFTPDQIQKVVSFANFVAQDTKS